MCLNRILYCFSITLPARTDTFFTSIAFRYCRHFFFNQPLRIVSWLIPVKHDNIFMFNHWSLFGVQMPCSLTFSHTQQYLNIFILLAISVVVNGWLAVITIAPFCLMMRFNCSHIGSNGMIESHLQAVVPYGGSANTISTLPLWISFMRSRQSPCINQTPLSLNT